MVDDMSEEVSSNRVGAAPGAGLRVGWEGRWQRCRARDACTRACAVRAAGG